MSLVDTFSGHHIAKSHASDATVEFSGMMPDCNLKDPSQPPPFSLPSKLLILYGEAKSYCSTVSCVPEGMFHYL